MGLPNRRVGVPKQEWARVALQEAWEEIKLGRGDLRGEDLDINKDLHVEALRRWAWAEPKNTERVAGWAPDQASTQTHNTNEETLAPGESVHAPASSHFVYGGDLNINEVNS